MTATPLLRAALLATLGLLATPAVRADVQSTAANALRMELGERTRLVVAPRPDRQPWLPEDIGRAPPKAALGLEFASPPSDGPQRLLRVQLSGDSVLNFRPRGGGLSVTYRSTF